MTAAAKHTPGPWRTQGWVPTWAYIPVHDAAHNMVCSLYPAVAGRYARADVEANARLIAEAPALLEALTDMLAGWRYIREHHGDLSGVGWERAQTAAESAIARATGDA